MIEIRFVLGRIERPRCARTSRLVPRGPAFPTDRRNIIGDTPWLTRAFGDVRVEQLMFPTDPPDGRMLDPMLRRRSRTHAGYVLGWTTTGTHVPTSWWGDATSGKSRHDMRRTSWRVSICESACSASAQRGGFAEVGSTRASPSGFEPDRFFGQRAA